MHSQVSEHVTNRLEDFHLRNENCFIIIIVRLQELPSQRKGYFRQDANNKTTK